MRRIPLLKTISALLLYVASICVSLAAVPLPTADESLTLLREGQFNELDRRFTAIQVAYEHRRLSDEDLRAAFRVFYATDASLEPAYQAWVEASPQSYVAHVARGIYYKKVGQERRGTDVIARTSDTQLDGMDHAYAIASEEFTASAPLTAKPLLSFFHAIDISTSAGDREESRRLLDRALAVDPRTFIVREKYMASLETRWGGSVDEMKEFLAACRHAKLSRAHLHELEASVAEDEGWTLQFQAGNAAAAKAAYLRAAKLDRKNSCRPCGPIAKAAGAAFDSGDFNGAIELYSKVLKQWPDAGEIRAHRGLSRLQINDVAGALEDLNGAAALNDPFAMEILGKMYLLGESVPRDRDKAIEWLTKSANLGWAESQAILPLAMNPAMTPMLRPGTPKL
jgi:tetratricopeptide (TPR) repeat protein